jgi:hypothetical protein
MDAWGGVRLLVLLSDWLDVPYGRAVLLGTACALVNFVYRLACTVCLHDIIFLHSDKKGAAAIGMRFLSVESKCSRLV